MIRLFLILSLSLLSCKSRVKQKQDNRITVYDTMYMEAPDTIKKPTRLIGHNYVDSFGRIHKTLMVFIRNRRCIDTIFLPCAAKQKPVCVIGNDSIIVVFDCDTIHRINKVVITNTGTDLTQYQFDSMIKADTTQ